MQRIVSRAFLCMLNGRLFWKPPEKSLGDGSHATSDTTQGAVVGRKNGEIVHGEAPCYMP